MKIEDTINIKKNFLEEKIEEAINKTKKDLEGLTTEPTCFIYSSVLGDNLRREHIANKIESTTEYDYSYIHQFNTVFKNDDEFYLIDLTYHQFHSAKFEELLEKGYMLVDEEKFNEYLGVVGNVNRVKRSR